ncbi:MAG: peptidoglycan-associated lipoprotein Pal [Betaproteobacteria bacterium]|nr:peptidoglycan-associated lipoprotein Pal [Betaproteobacteria bacterium]
MFEHPDPGRRHPRSTTGGGAPPAPPTAPAGGATTTGTGGRSGVRGRVHGRGRCRCSAWATRKSILSKRSVFFDYDSYVVKDEYRALVEAHAKYLQANRGAKVTMQGHTDERGTREYNIALGQRRADAVKKMMLLLGASDAQIETVSFGKEKPRNPASGEAAWADNRRVEIVHAGE